MLFENFVEIKLTTTVLCREIKNFTLLRVLLTDFDKKKMVKETGVVRKIFNFPKKKL